jgi:DNA-binding SARP family transcriptional activator/TolB-like protein
MPIQLRVLGSLELYSDAGVEMRRVLQQPKRLGLLSYLTICTPRRFHRRDLLLALFWPDLDTEHARAALRRALYFLRHEVGDGVLVGRGDEEVGIAPEGCTCDAVRFEAEAVAGHDEAALELYRGNLLEGFYIQGAPEAVDWLDGQRTRLRELALRSAWRLAAAETTPPEKAIHWGRWATNLAPDDEDNVGRFISLLSRLGDRSRAAQVYAEYARRLSRQEAGGPSEGLRRLVEQVWNSPLIPPVSPNLASSTPVPAAIPEAPEGTPGPARTVIVVMPFAVRGHSGTEYLGEAVMELLSTAFHDAGALHALDSQTVLLELGRQPQATGPELARFFNTTRYLDGTVIEAGGRLRITATLRTAPEGEIVGRGEGEAPEEGSLFAVVDDIVRQILASQVPDPHTSLVRSAARTGASIPALKAFLRAEKAFREGRLIEAIGGFNEATEREPEFAAAHYRLAGALASAAQPDAARGASARAVALGDTVSDRTRLLFLAQQAWLAGNAREAELRYLNIIARWPEDVEGWYLLGDLRLHTNTDRGLPVADAREPLERALALDPGHLGAIAKLARLAALRGDYAELTVLSNKAQALAPDGEQTLFARALFAVCFDRTEDQEAIIRMLPSARALTLLILFGDVAMYTGDLARAERFCLHLTDLARAPDLKAITALGRAYLALAQGRVEEGLQMIWGQAEAAPSWSRELSALAVVASVFPRSAVPWDDTRASLERWNPPVEGIFPTGVFGLHDDIHAHLRLYLLARFAAREGKANEAVSTATALSELPVAGETALVVQDLLRELDAEVRALGGRHGEALALLEAPLPGVWYQFAVGSPFSAGAERRFRRAQLLEACGRPRDAIPWYTTIAQRSPWELLWAAPAALQLGRLYDRLGEPANALPHYRRFTTLWQRADPSLQGLVQEVDQRIHAIQAS